MRRLVAAKKGCQLDAARGQLVLGLGSRCVHDKKQRQESQIQRKRKNLQVEVSEKNSKTFKQISFHDIKINATLLL